MKIINTIQNLMYTETERRRLLQDIALISGNILINEGFGAFQKYLSSFFYHNNEFKQYDDWIKHNEPTKDDMDKITDKLKEFSYHPKISIITPVWEVDERWLRFAIESVIRQTYDNWELCLVDAGSTKKYIKPILEEYAKTDSRIKVKFLTENKGIAENSNEAISTATGEFVGFLDHDDELAPFALYEIIKVLNQNQELQFIYSDEDKIDEKGKRRVPYFKPDWSPDLFLSCNYLCHFSVIRKSILDDIAGFREGYSGSQDYDLFLRVIERIKEADIAHIPKILYHWRMIPQSASASTGAKPYAYTAAKKAITDAMKRRCINIDGVFDGLWTGSYRVKYKIHSNPCVSIIILVNDNLKNLKKCVKSVLKKTKYQNYEIIITGKIDNHMIMSTIDYFKKINPNIKIMPYEKNLNISAIQNYASGFVNSHFILFLNSDTTIISEDWLSSILEHAQREGVGAVAGVLNYHHSPVQYPAQTSENHSIVINSPDQLQTDNHGYYGRFDVIQNCNFISRDCLMIKKDIFNEIGKFDEILSPDYGDEELCYRIRLHGYKIISTPYARLYSHKSMLRKHKKPVTNKNKGD